MANSVMLKITSQIIVKIFNIIKDNCASVFNG